MWRLKDRMFVILTLAICFFTVLAIRLFYLQIVNGETYLHNLSLNIVKELKISSPRGKIIDRFGRVIADNKLVFNVKVDPSLKIDNWNESFYNIIQLLEKNNEEYADDLPITKTEPFAFTFTSSRSQERWMKDMNLDKTLDAAATIKHLRELFEIPTTFDNVTARKIISLRAKLYLQRYRQYAPIIIASNVSDKTLVAIEEQNKKYPAIYTESEYIRDYSNGKCFSNLIGYLGHASTDDEYEADDVIGKAGLEKSFQKQLRGVDGKLLVQVNNVGKRVGVLERHAPQDGDNLVLTIDKRLQEQSYDILEDVLSKILRTKLSDEVTIFTSLTDYLSIKKIFNAAEQTHSSRLKSYITKLNPTCDSETVDGQRKIRELLSEAIRTKQITPKDILFAMLEQKVISGDEKYIANTSVQKILSDKISAREITPGMINMDACTGSVIVTDVNTGDVLTAISYPSYDNNQLANGFNSDYYNQMMLAKNTPMVNRVFMEPRAPGSTFKMITAITGLEKKAIAPNTVINDETVFKKAGVPYSRCWSTHSHGALTVASALEVSCNYFFFETAFRLGTTRSNNAGIRALNEYMKAFGLNERTGVEIGELYDFTPEGVSNISSPEYKQSVGEKTPWYDGDTIRTAIGQSKNNYTAANMVKYISTLATRGTRYQLHLLNEIKDNQNATIERFTPNAEYKINLQPQTLDAVYKGMLLVTEGSRGTARNVFANFSIRVAGKTGTAQENNKRHDHSSFGGFAPFDNPQIAVYVLIPYGDNKIIGAAAAQVARDVISAYFNPQTQFNISTVNSLTK